MAITGISAISGEQIIAAGAVSAREAASAAFTTGGNSLQGLYDTVSNNSGSWTGGSTYTGDAQGALDEVYLNSANWNSTYTTVSDNSASWTGGAGGGLPMAIGDSAVFNSGYEMNNEYLPSLYISGNMRNYPSIQVRGGYSTEGESGTLHANYISFHTGFTTLTSTYQVLRLDRFGLSGKSISQGDWYFRPYEYGLLTGTYDTVSNNSASWGGGSTYTGDAQGALDEVYSNSGTWNSTTETVSSNSGTWGGSALPISAGPGIKLEMVNNTLVASNDETVLWSGNLTVGNTAQMTEPVSAFERYKFYLLGYERKLKVVNEFWTDGSSAGNEPYKVNPIIFQASEGFFTINAGDCKWNTTWDNLQYVTGYNKWMPFNTSTWNQLDTNKSSPTIVKIVGINRIAGV